jgi:hypothetical protein
VLAGLILLTRLTWTLQPWAWFLQCTSLALWNWEHRLKLTVISLVFLILNLHINRRIQLIINICYSKVWCYSLHHTHRTSRLSGQHSPASYSWGPEFKSQRGDRRFWPRFFVGFLSPFRQMYVQYLKLGHDHFLPHTFQLIIHQSPHHSTLIIWATDSVVKEITNKIHSTRFVHEHTFIQLGLSFSVLVGY